ncbi:MAG: Nif3-like dinuclear metal center hexameric protein, partial [Armatimonadota bacterium]
VMHGSEEDEVEGIAVGWIASERAVREAEDRGLNLFVSHEGLFYEPPQADTSVEETFQARREMLDELGMTVVRCHDTWDRMPEIGIPDAWATWLGFEVERAEEAEANQNLAPHGYELSSRMAYYRVCLTGGMALDRLAQVVAQRCTELGQSAALVAGDGSRFVHRMVIGTGAITRLTEMMALEPDCILATDDGVNWTRDVLYAQGMDAPLIVVSHPASELPGMMRLADHLAERFPDVPARYVPVEYPRTIAAR